MADFINRKRFKTEILTFNETNNMSEWLYYKLNELIEKITKKFFYESSIIPGYAWTDIKGDTFLKCLLTLNKLTPNSTGSSMFSYLTTVIRNFINDILRKIQKRGFNLLNIEDLCNNDTELDVIIDPVLMNYHGIY